MTDDTSNIESPTDAQERLIAALRRELAEYGALLQLLEVQQAAVLDRKPDQVLESIPQIDAQLELTSTRRKEREATADELALATGIPLPATLRTLAPRFRPAVRPLVEALTDEVNRLIGHTRRRAEQNQLLLARSVELAQEMVSRLSPRAISKTYSAKGRVKIKPAAGASRLLDRS
jgi:flagellar biosynthesis/type III secretory pathway chaperone